MTKDQLHEFIRDDDLDGLASALATFIPEGEELHRQQLLQLQSQLKDYKRRVGRGVLSTGEQSLEKNKLRDGFINLINSLFNEGKANKQSTNNPSPKKTSKWLNWKTGGAALALLATLATISGITLKDFFKPKSWVKAPFNLSVFVEAQNDIQACQVEAGILRLILGGDARDEKIDDNCKAVFPGIPAGFINKKIPVLFRYKELGYELLNPDSQYLLTADTRAVTVAIKKDDSLGWVKGKIYNSDMTARLEGVQVEVEGKVAYSDSLGNFSIYIPAEEQKEMYDIVLTKQGYQLKRLRHNPAAETQEYMLNEN